jgi:ABC-type transport system involved in multi-copper enzyme maturation permease subunit
MNRAIIGRLMLKDWYLSRVPLTLIGIAGVISTVLLYQGETAGAAGIISALISLVFLSILIPQLTVVNERKQQNLAFVMSLPISPAEYTMSKVLGNLSAFVALWVAIVGAVLGTIAAVPGAGGIIPLGIIGALAPFVAFCLLLAVAIITESELLSMVTMGATNVAYSFWWFLFRLPGLREDLKSPVPVWSDAILTIIGGQIAVIVLALALTFYFQSRKRSFI